MVLPYWQLEQPACGFWMLQTFQNLALARLWALGSVLDCGRSCADCGLWALAAMDALLEVPLAGLWHTISLFLVVRNGPSGLFLAYRLLHVLLLVFHLSSADVKPVAAHCPVINLSRRDIACDQATTMRACVLMLLLFIDFSITDVKPVTAHCPVINLSRRDIACDQATTMRACVLMLLLFIDFSITDVKPVAAHCPVINLSRRDIACDQATTIRWCGTSTTHEQVRTPGSITPFELKTTWAVLPP